jgi:predicted alpha-1,2-mannosidase
MTEIQRPSTRPCVSRWTLAAVLATAGILGAGMTSAVAASPTPPSPSATATPSPAPGGPSAAPNARSGGRQAGNSPAVCSTGPSGRLLNCPKPVARKQRPHGARNTARVNAPVSNLAQLVDTRTWTSGGGNTFPGAEVPFGMTQWSPDTLPNRSAGGGYNFGDTSITGYSLTHVSGPGCGAAGDIPMLPMTGPLPSGNPNDVQTNFSNTNEIAQAGYYSAQTNQPDTITSQFTATPHSSMGRFTYPATTQAGFLIKLHDSQNGEFAPSTATVVNNQEVSGSETSGHFCGEDVNDGQKQEYTVHFDITFDQPFTTSQVINGSDGTPTAVYLAFDTTTNPVVQAKLATSYVSDANAHLDWQTENPTWNFDATKAVAQQDWNDLLGRMQVSGGDYARTQMFYSLLYKDFVQPNISSDVNGEYMGADMTVHTISGDQQDQYGTYSGWDIYHSLSQLQAMLDPSAAGDQAQSLLNYYDQDKILQQWGYLNNNNYVMVGDPAQSIIADYYAFGAHNFDTTAALKDMLAQATTTNDVRPGQNLEDSLGYLPEDGSYRSCCNPHGYVSSLLEYNTEDLALSRFAAALGDRQDAKMLEQRANNWQNVFYPANNLLNPRNSDGSWVPDITPTTTDHYVEGDAYEYLWNVPNNYASLFSLMGGPKKAAAALREFLSQPNGFGMFAQLTNEFGFGEQYALDYARDPAGTQQVVNNIRNTMYQPGPSLDNNDDLGANSSTFIWEMLGMYPENSGTGDLVFNSPGFPHAAITLPNGKTITINAPGASPDRFYVKSLQINHRRYDKLYVPYSKLAHGATLHWNLGTKPTKWGSSRKDAPRSYKSGMRPVIGYLSQPQVTVAPGGTASVTVGAANTTTRKQSVRVNPTAPSGLTVTTGRHGGKIHVPSNGRRTITLHVHANSTAKQTFYTVPIALTTGGGRPLPGLKLTVLVAQPGSLLRAFNNEGVSDDANVNAANFDGGGWSYSAEALAAQGVTPDGTVTSGGISYNWPPSQPGEPDNAIASGQQVTVNAPAGTRQLGFLGAASGGASQGLATLTYSDGSTARYWLGLSDWTLGGGAQQPSFGNQTVITTTYRNCNHCTGGRDSVNTNVFSAVLPVDASKTLSSVTLPPGSTGGDLHVFAIGTSSTAMSGPVVMSVDPNTVSAGDTVTLNGSGFGATQGSGYVAFSDNNTDWGQPGNPPTLTVNSWSDTQITFTVPTPSGTNGQWHVAPGSTAMVSVVNDAAQASDTAALDIAPTANLADYYDNTGISSDGDTACQADYDGDGYSYSAQALAAAGVSPGGTVTVDGLDYTWPNVPACQPDNILAAGQKILVNGAAGASKLGLLGSSGNGSAQGPVTVTYTDGTSDTSQLYFGDWAQSPSSGNITAVTTPYRNQQGGGTQQITMYIFAAEVAIDSSKTVASVTLPSIADQVGSNASTHIFALTTGG